MSLKLYSSANPVTAGAKVEVLLRFFNFNVQLVRIPIAEWKSPEYLKKHPWGKIPTLETPEGCIFESHSIMRYFARKAGKMYGTNPAETASIDQWLEFINTQINPNLAKVHYAILGYFPITKEQYEQARKQLWQDLKVVDGWLKNNKFLGLNEFSIADVSMATILRHSFRLILDEKNRKNLPNLTKWFEEVSNLKEFQIHFGKLWLCQKQFVPDFSEVHLTQQKKEQKKEEKKEEKKEKKKEEKKPQEQAQKQQKKKVQKKQQTKKKQQPKQQKKEDAAPEQEEEEEKDYLPKKKTNPLDQLPKSPFNVEQFKREICNAEDKLAVLKKLWANFDIQGWSLWRVHYIKYEDEGVVGYLTSNLKNGHIRNIDHFRKYCFASYGIYGVEGNYEIDGIWMWRGTEIPQQWKEHQSYDYFTFEKLDPKNEGVQKVTEQYWLNLKEGQLVEGKPVFDADWFK